MRHLRTFVVWLVGTWLIGQAVVVVVSMAGYDLTGLFAWMWGL